MQTFLPYSDFSMTAKVLDRQRLGKQRVECLQILKALQKGPYTSGKKTPWYNHPAVQLWNGYPWALYTYLIEICQEWSNRGYKDTCYNKAFILVNENFPNISNNILPNWIGNESFHSAHRAALLYKNFSWYEQFGWKEKPKIEYLWM